MTVLACDIVLHFLHSLMFMRWGMAAWHFFPYLLFLVLILPALIDTAFSIVPQRFAALPYWSGIVAIVILGAMGNYRRMRRRRETTRLIGKPQRTKLRCGCASIPIRPTSSP